MGKAWSDIRHSLAHTGDVRVWTRQYPWVAAGTALAAGVAAGYLLTPRDRDEAREMWEKLKDQLHAAKGDAETVAAAPKSERAPKASLLGTILKEGIKLATPFITSVIGASMGGGAGRNGHDPSTEPPKSDGDHI